MKKWLAPCARWKPEAHRNNSSIWSKKKLKTLKDNWHKLFWLIIIIILITPLLYWSTGIGQQAINLSAEVRYGPDGQIFNSSKAEARHSLLLPMQIQRLLLYPLLLLAFQFSGRAIRLRRWISSCLGNNLSQPSQGIKKGLEILLFVLIFHLALFLLYLPLNFYSRFILAHQFGLSTQTAGGWLEDWLKSVLIALVINGLLWTGLYSLMRWSPRRWPIWSGASLVFFNFIFMFLTPILITPLFYEVRPLDDPELRQRLFALAEQAEMSIGQIEVIDASSKTNQVNAYVISFGEAQRMVFYDTLLADYTPDQIEVVLAHELGHWYYGHVFWSILGLSVAGWLGLFGLSWFLQHYWQRLGLEGPADVAGLPYVLAVVAIATMLSLPVQNFISRTAEAQADRFALEASQKPAAFITLFEQMAEQNLSLVHPPAWEKFIFYTHPPIRERIHEAKIFSSSSKG